MAARWLLPFCLSFLSARVLALDWYCDSSCAGKFGEVSVDEMLSEAVEMVLQSMDDGDPKMLEAFRQIFKFDYESPGPENEKHLDTWFGEASSEGGTATTAVRIVVGQA